MMKTTKQRLIEMRAGQDIRLVMIRAYQEAGGNILRAAALIQQWYGEPMSFGVFHDWIGALNGKVAKRLEFDDFDAAAPGTPAAEIAA